jgi:hypothetical protein
MLKILNLPDESSDPKKPDMRVAPVVEEVRPVGAEVNCRFTPAKEGPEGCRR